METEAWSRLIERARADLDAAGILNVPAQYHNACYHAQQAAEKSLKALLRNNGISYPKTHDLGTLVDLVRRLDSGFPEFVVEAETLTQFAVEARYRESARADIDDTNTREAIEYSGRIFRECQGRLKPSAP